MFQNYFRTAWRNLLRNRSYSAVNILGLAIGMAVALLIGLWVQYQYSYDRWLPGYKQVAQVRMRFVRNGETVAGDGDASSTGRRIAEGDSRDTLGRPYGLDGYAWTGCRGA